MTNFTTWALRYRLATRPGDRDDIWRDIFVCLVTLVPVRMSS